MQLPSEVFAQVSERYKRDYFQLYGPSSMRHIGGIGWECYYEKFFQVSFGEHIWFFPHSDAQCLIKCGGFHICKWNKGK
jgi:hypothetical protein